MNNTRMPRIRVELEGVRQTVQHMFMDYQDGLAAEVSATIEKTMTEAWVQDQININVRSCIQKAIQDISDNYNLRTAITGMVSDQVAKLITGKS